MKSLQINPRELSETGSWCVAFEAGRLVYGEDALEQLGRRVVELGCRSVFLVTDPGIRSAGHVARAERSLADARVECTVFDRVTENPSSGLVARGCEAAAAGSAPDCIVALGGGSSMDCAKGINFVLTNGGTMEDYWGSGKATLPMLPSIGIPTTAGTGSEAQSYALISHEQTRVKMACGDPKARFRTVILDPALTATAPAEVRAVSGIDALSHAVESHVTTTRNPVSQVFSREAWRLLSASLEQALRDPDDRDARGRMLLGSFFAGNAIEHSMLGAAHACANPLTTRFGITHGIAVGVMLPHVVQFNTIEVGQLYTELGGESGDPVSTVGERFRRLRAAAGLPERLRDCGVPADAVGPLADEASKQWTVAFNPRPVSAEELRELYESAY